MDAIAQTATRRLDSSLHAVGTSTPATSVESARTLSVTADYRLSEAGRKASLLSGGNGHAEQRVKIAVPLTRLHLVHVDNNGVARLKLRPQFKLNTDQRIIKIKFAPVYDHPPTLDELFQDPVPTYVVEFLLGRYCASTNEKEIAEGLEIVEKQLKDRTVRTGDQEIFKARARDTGPVKL